MIEKRFIIDEDGNITDTETDRTLYVENKYTACNYYINLLNELNNENEEFKKALLELKEIGDYQYGRIKELSDENEQLVKMLNNAANYVQREHREMPLDDFVEWWNDMVTEGLDD